jgi:transposase-like protein
MKVAKAKGLLRGKQPRLNRKQEAHLVSLVHSGEYSTAEVAELFGVGRSTVYRAIERQRVAAKAGLAEASSRPNPATAPTVPYPTPHRDAGVSARQPDADIRLGLVDWNCCVHSAAIGRSGDFVLSCT